METREPGTAVPTINRRISTDWMAAGECAGIGATTAERFFGDQADQRRAALEYCGTCPVQMTCFAYGEATQSFGVWGGMTEEQRQRRRQKIAERQAVAAA